MATDGRAEKSGSGILEKITAKVSWRVLAYAQTEKVNRTGRSLDPELYTSKKSYVGEG